MDPGLPVSVRVHISPRPGGGAGRTWHSDGMPAIDIADEVFVTTSRRTLAQLFSDPASWRRHWPDLTLDVSADRGDKGMRWTVSGRLAGSMEVWLEPVLDGTVLHYYLRADPTAPMSPGPREKWCREETRRRRLEARRLAFELKRTHEGSRAPGCPPKILSK